MSDKRGSYMNAVGQNPARPLVVLERDALVVQTLLGKTSAHPGPVFLVSDLHRCARALTSLRRTPLLILGGKPLETTWPQWVAQVTEAVQARQPIVALDMGALADESPAGCHAVWSMHVDHHLTVSLAYLFQQSTEMTAAYGPLHFDPAARTMHMANRLNVRSQGYRFIPPTVDARRAAASANVFSFSPSLPSRHGLQS